MLTMRAMDEQGKWLPKSRKVYDLDANEERIRLSSGNYKSHKENTVDWNDPGKAEVRAVIKAKGLRGEHLNRLPYGYQEDPEQKGRWIIDPETAPIVKRIFDLAMQGKGPAKIATIPREK